MNKILIVGRLTRDPETNSTNSGIKYTRFTIAVGRQFADNQTDFIPVVAWRNQADFIDNYVKKGGLISVEGRFTSSTFQNADGQNITRYEVTADRVSSLETKGQVEQRIQNTQSINVVKSAADTQVIEFEKQSTPETIEEKEEESNNIPWELDL